MSRRNSDLPIWNFFEKPIDGSKTATCNYCQRDLSFKTSITNLKQHLKQKHISVYDNLLNFGKVESETETASALHSQDGNSSETDSAFKQTSIRARPPKRKTTESTDLSKSEVLHSVNEHFKYPVITTTDDRFDIFGKNVAIKLRELPREQRLIAEKIINDTLFQAEMGNLTLPQNEYQQHEFIYVAPIASRPPRQTQQ